MRSLQWRERKVLELRYGLSSGEPMTLEAIGSEVGVTRERDLETALRSLQWRERKVLELRYGLSSGEPMTLEAIGSEVGVTRERVRQIESRTLSKLKASREAQKLKDTTDN